MKYTNVVKFRVNSKPNPCLSAVRFTGAYSGRGIFYCEKIVDEKTATFVYDFFYNLLEEDIKLLTYSKLVEGNVDRQLTLLNTIHLYRRIYGARITIEHVKWNESGYDMKTTFSCYDGEKWHTVPVNWCLDGVNHYLLTTSNQEVGITIKKPATINAIPEPELDLRTLERVILEIAKEQWGAG